MNGITENRTLAIAVIGILVQRLGGVVEVTQDDFNSIASSELHEALSDDEDTYTICVTAPDAALKYT